MTIPRRRTYACTRAPHCAWQALVPSNEVLARVESYLVKLRDAATSADWLAEGDGEDERKGWGSRPVYEWVVLKSMHDTTTSAAAAAATAELLHGNSSITVKMSGLAADTLKIDDKDVDTSGDSSPARVIRAVKELLGTDAGNHLLTSSASSVRSKQHQVLLVMPSYLVGIPLLIAAAWASGMQAYSLPMLMQTEAEPCAPGPHTWHAHVAPLAFSKSIGVRSDQAPSTHS